MENAYKFKVEYDDTDGDKIAIMDDDDLQLAYEEASQQPTGNLKLFVTKVDQKLTANKSKPISHPVSSLVQDDDKMSSSSSDSDEEKQDDFEVVKAKNQKNWKEHKGGHNKRRKMMKKFIKHTIK